jgi:hypothetical protein
VLTCCLGVVEDAGLCWLDVELACYHCGIFINMLA